MNERKAGRELDAEVAEKVLGCKVQWVESFESWAMSPHPTCTCVDVAHDSGDRDMYDLRHYSTDIAAAYEMENEIERRGVRWRYIQAIGLMAMEMGIGQEHYEDWGWFLAHASPELRCLAALKAVGA